MPSQDRLSEEQKAQVVGAALGIDIEEYLVGRKEGNSTHIEIDIRQTLISGQVSEMFFFSQRMDIFETELTHRLRNQALRNSLA